MQFIYNRCFKLWFIRLSGEYTFFFVNQSHTLSSLLNSAKTILRKCIYRQEGATEAVRISFAVNMMCLSRGGIEQITCCNNWMSCSWYVAWHDNCLRLSYCIWLKPVQKTYLFLFQVLLRGASSAQKNETQTQKRLHFKKHYSPRFFKQSGNALHLSLVLSPFITKPAWVNNSWRWNNDLCSLRVNEWHAGIGTQLSNLSRGIRWVEENWEQQEFSITLFWI